MTMIDTPDAMAHFQMCQCIGRLRIETRTGMTFRGQSTLTIVQQKYGIKARTKAKALAQLEALYVERYGREYGSDQPFAR